MEQFVSPLPAFKGGSSGHNFASIQSLPSVMSARPTAKSREHVSTFFNNRQILRTICDWFETWMPWQRRIVLCGTTDRCSTAQLEYLATALEPVFHRDFQTSLRGSYPPLTAKHVIPTNTQLEKAVQLADGGYEVDSENKLHTQTASQQPTHELLHNFAANLVRKVVAEAIKGFDGTQSEPSTENSVSTGSEESQEQNHKAKLKRDQRRKPSPIAEVQEDADIILSIALQTLDQTSHSEVTSPTSSRESALRVPKSDKTSFTKHSSASSQLGFLQIERKSVDSASFVNKQNKSFGRPLESSFSTRPSERRKERTRSDAYNQYYCGQEDTSLTNDTTLGESQLNTLPPLEAKKVSTFNWCVNHRVTPSVPSTANSTASQYSRPQHRNKVQPIPGSAASTADFFDKKKIQKLGPMKGVLRTGQINKPPYVEDIHISLQKAFKPSKWWTRDGHGRPMPSGAAQLVSAKKQPLRAVFKEQLEQIWAWLKEWEDHEKGDLLVELIKMCDQELIRFFASCLMKRLQQYMHWLADRMDINSLPDRVLLNVFSLLSPGDLLQVEGVCHRWQFLVSHEELWRFKCKELGVMHNIPDLVLLVEFYMSENTVDWKEAYRQLSEVLAQGRPETGSRCRSRDPSYSFWKKLSERINQLRAKYLPPAESDTESSVELNIAVTAARTSSPCTDTPKEEGDQPDDRQEAGESTTPPLSSEKSSRRKQRLQSSKMEEIALDIRPELQRAKNLLEPSVDDGPLHYDGKIKQVKRVRRLQGHGDGVCCVMFDTRRLVTGSMDRSIRVWDIRSGKSVRKLCGHRGGVRCLQFDETHIISGSWDMSVKVWDAVKFELLAELSGHMGVVSCLQFNNCHLVTGSHDSTIRIWCMESFQCLHIIEHHSHAVTCLDLQSQVIVSGSFDRTVKLTDVKTGACLHSMRHEKQDRITTIHCYEGQILAGTLTGNLMVWDQETGTILSAYQVLDSPIYRLVVAPSEDRDTKMMVASGDGSVSEWVLETMMCVRVLQGHRGPVRDMQASESRLVSVSEDKTVRIWDLSPPSLKPGVEEDTISTQIVNERDSD
ncbi:uncharacterized protein [Diadema antillarum]|uniref:uncharacterized protein n=1 Tax=Diadema antillarum TaxID=105358 RepID=UPI003A8A7B1C